MSSKRRIAFYQTAAYWLNGLENATTCSRAEKEAGVVYTDEERKKLWEASEHLVKAKELFTDVWSARIGMAITAEARLKAGGY